MEPLPNTSNAQNLTTIVATPLLPEGQPEQKRPKFKVLIWGVVVMMLVVLGAGALYVASFLEKTLKNAEETTATIPTTEAFVAVNPGKLTIGTDPTFEPMEFYDELNNIVGYDMDLGRKLAEEMGLTAEIRNIHWERIFDALDVGEIDIILSSVTITDERKEKYDFSEPYINAGQVIITQKEDASITTTGDLAGKKIAVQENTTNEAEAKKYTTEDLVLSFRDFNEATDALLAGKADAIFADLTVAKGITKANPTLKISSEPVTSEYYGVVIRKGNTPLLIKVNETLNTLRQQGFPVYLKQKWLE